MNNPVYFDDEYGSSAINLDIPDQSQGNKPSDMDWPTLRRNSIVRSNFAIKPSRDGHKSPERWYWALLQITIPFIVAGLGMVCAEIHEVFILVPPLLGLKGNLEMSLAARLSTQANLDMVSTRRSMITAVLGNFALTQLQSIVIGFLASFITCVTTYFLKDEFNPSHLLILTGSSVNTSSFSSFILGNFLTTTSSFVNSKVRITSEFGALVMFVIILCQKYHINPDNVAAPIASSLGDFITLGLLAYIGTFLLNNQSKIWIHIVLIVINLSIIPLMIIYCRKNEFVKQTLTMGWFPIIGAMIISSIAGVILELTTEKFSGISVFQPVVNGVGGNLVSIFACRLSTSLYSTCNIGSWADWSPRKYIHYPFETFFGKRNTQAHNARMLMMLVVPGHLLFFFVIHLVDSNTTTTSPNISVWLVLFYMILASLQVILLFMICYFVTHLVWRLKRNPDDFSIPILTAMGDFFGVCFLYFCFLLTFRITGDQSLVGISGNASTPLHNATSTAYSISSNSFIY